MTFDTLIFDLDGTLIHSAPDLQAAINHALVELGRTPLNLSQVISFIGNGVEKLVERALVATGEASAEVQAHALALFMAYYETHMTTLTCPYPNVIETLAALKDQGFRLGICTNKPTQPAQKICDALHLNQYFDVISGAEGGLPKKPDPTPLLTCVSDLGGMPETTLYLGDSGVDYQTATNAGIAFRLFSKGYLNDVLPNLPDDGRFADWSVANALGHHASQE